MAVEKAIRSILVDDGTVAGLVGNRIYPLVRPDGTGSPAITYQQISGFRDHVMTGPSGFVESRFQLNCWADTYAEADALADAVRSAVDGYSGTKESVVIQGIHLVDEGDAIVLQADNESLNERGKRLDITVWFDE